ncbi:MAG: twin-arginine translocation signal domain-containing protein [Candidatus Marinimicrobia bacterium]|nr:twin-arginine translocation signal domain-containing protein [Candidatus Neomarinimicrobiota bacterium]MCF7830202.1 twin-arginine translocation signal domain-containing protein [Candidatus Neomarinimicrobiota bacterium]MCF7880819.1 twin-arginine translocation signal domain-containing protein [Candidatus Neomarinimicrobiota bacterium]
MSNNINRRHFIKAGAVTGLAVTFAPNILLGKKDDRKVRIGFIGVGSQGTNLLKVCLGMEDVEVPAICDIDPEHLARAQRLVEKSGRKKPEGYSKSETDYKNMVVRDDLDGVIIATPWVWHTPMSVDTMRAGKYCAPEVWGASSVDEVWQLVRASEESGMPCMMLENHCYDRDSMAILNMVRKGLFGELIHCQCGYQHDVRYVKFGPTGELRWRGHHSVKRNGDLYPTHGVGPIANCLDIDRGNRFLTMTSTATKSRGIKDYIARKFSPDHPNANREYALGDIVTSVIKCANGETIVINHDTNLPRPYSNMYRVQGTRGLWMEDNMSIYLEGISPEETWEPFEPYMKKYEHPLWKKFLSEDIKAGHGGADYLKTRAFVECVKRQIPTPIDVYDTASWIVISPLSEHSIARGSEPVEFPDFTKGKWMRKEPIFGLTDEY